MANRVDPYTQKHGCLLEPCPYVPRRRGEDVVYSVQQVQHLSTYMYVGYIHAGAGHDARFAPRGVAIDRNVPANVRIKRPLVPAMDIDEGWTGWRTSGTESGRGSCVPATVLWTPLFEVIKLSRSWSGYLTKGPSQRWEEGAPPVEMETHHELIIIIIQCLWAAVGSPSKREDNVGAQSGPVEMLLPPAPA
ncbi:hypothetical protein LA080_013166 [Diaporthe eres]|nr:hypothetical protein LA080_013166 [Diaporthe eres]